MATPHHTKQITQGMIASDSYQAPRQQKLTQHGAMSFIASLMLNKSKDLSYGRASAIDWGNDHSAQVHPHSYDPDRRMPVAPQSTLPSQVRSFLRRNTTKWTKRQTSSSMGCHEHGYGTISPIATPAVLCNIPSACAKRYHVI